LKVSAADPVAPAGIRPAVWDLACTDGAADRLFAPPRLVCGLVSVELGVKPGLRCGEQFLEQGGARCGRLLSAVFPQRLGLLLRFAEEVREPRRQAWKGREVLGGS
jgi:hypothetical protein